MCLVHHASGMQVRSPGGSQSAFYDDLAAAQSSAESQSLGLWTKVAPELPFLDRAYATQHNLPAFLEAALMPSGHQYGAEAAIVLLRYLQDILVISVGS